jgi:hypothetical protein
MHQPAQIGACRGSTIELGLAKRSDVEEHVPGFLLGKDKRDERGHIRCRTAILQDPKQFTIRPGRLPDFIGKVAGQFATETGNIAESFSISAVTGGAEGLPMK